MNAIPMPHERIASELTSSEIVSLTLLKWRYQLQTMGFTVSEARHLLSIMWSARHMNGNY